MKAGLFQIGLAVFLFWGNMAYAEPLHLVTEDYPPFNMRVSELPTGDPDDPLTGISVDIIRELFKRAGVEYTFHIYPWERAYDTALNTPGYGIFSIVRTPEREALFQWVGPLIVTKWVLMAKKSRNIKLSSLDDARKYKIGGYKGGAAPLFVEKQGLTVEYYIYNHFIVRKLEAEKLDLWPITEIVGHYVAKREGVSVEPALLLKESAMSMGFNKSVSADLIAKLNKTLQDMKDDGTVEKIYARYR
jgi:polar amino acid transport system substrate-binding protein